MGYHVVRSDEHEYQERPNVDGEASRLAADVTSAADLKSSRARMWRYPPHSRGRRHLDPDQEEVFVPLRGTLTLLVEDPPQRVSIDVFVNADTLAATEFDLDQAPAPPGRNRRWGFSR